MSPVKSIIWIQKLTGNSLEESWKVTIDIFWILILYKIDETSRKALCVAIIDLSVLKIVSTAYTQCAPVQALITSEKKRQTLAQ